MSAAGWSGWWPSAGPISGQITRSTGMNGVVMPHGRVSRYITGSHEGSSGYNAGYNVASWVNFTKSEGMGLYANWYVRLDPAWRYNWNGRQWPENDGNYKDVAYSVCCSPYEMPNNWYLSSFLTNPDADMAYMSNDDNVTTPSFQNPDADGNNPYYHDAFFGPAREPASDPSKWVKDEFEMVITSQTGYTGYIKLWNNGVFGVNYPGRTDRYAGTSRTFGIGGYSRDYPDPNNRCYFADVYIDTTRARAVLCSGATFAARGYCEPQIPTAWSASSITVTVNPGRFADHSTAYLYVCDSNAACNSNGHAVTIASAGQGDTVAPSAPNALRVDSAS